MVIFVICLMFGVGFIWGWGLCAMMVANGRRHMAIETRRRRRFVEAMRRVQEGVKS
ncbi:hypothetical protein M0R72_13940 [Candidatus Pacearchaeota archaeon]|jgi:uncharacterized membrane protein YciS (DUF1049 family)|nr:hypothetical protein [Candidatus Pacearchaeota archaeon]